MPEEKIGAVTHFFNKAMVAALELSGEIQIGDRVHFHGHTTDFEQQIESMQIEHKEVKEAKKGESIGLKVKDRVREGDRVYIVSE